MRYFVGANFKQNFIQFKKIDSFRQRFDPKYQISHALQMTLLPPFDLETEIPYDFIQEMEEIFEHYLVGLDSLKELTFKGASFRTGRTHLLYLVPEIHDDLFHCLEAIKEIIVDRGGTFNLQKSMEPVLPMGRFEGEDLLHTAFMLINEEFQFPYTLPVRSISLYEKRKDCWPVLSSLYTIDDKDSYSTRRQGENSFLL